MMTDTGPWIEDWLSAPRFAVYLADADGDRALALARYDWNARAGAVFLHDIGHLEVALRNAYDRALRSRDRPGDPHWVYAPRRHFPERIRGGKDANWWPLNEIKVAIGKAQATSGSAEHPAPGKVIAELNFGFWTSLTTGVHDQPIWRPRLHRAFPRGTRRHNVHAQIDRLRRLRNRAAHNESLLDVPLRARHDDLLAVARLLSTRLHDHIADRSPVPTVLTDRP